MKGKPEDLKEEPSLDFFGLTELVKEIGTLDDEEIIQKIESFIDQAVVRNPPLLLERKFLKYQKKYKILRDSTINRIFGFIEDENAKNMDSLFDNTERMIFLLKKRYNPNNGIEKNTKEWESKFRDLFINELKILLKLYTWLMELYEKPLIGDIMAVKLKKYGFEDVFSNKRKLNVFLKGANRIIQVYENSN